MKKVIKNNASIMSLILAIIFLIIGAVMFTRPEFIVLVFSYVMGGIIILFGVYNCIKNYIEVVNLSLLKHKIFANHCKMVIFLSNLTFCYCVRFVRLI